MKIQLTNILQLLVMIAFSFIVKAQEVTMTEIKEGKDSGITAICKRSANDMVIRWAPDDAGLWLESLGGIVRIERLHFNSFAERDESKAILVTDSLRPWSPSRIEREMIAHPHKQEYIMAGALLYGEWESIDTTKEDITMEDITNRYEELTNRYSNALLLADISKDGAEVLGLRFVDLKVEDSNYISYRITLILPDGTYYQTSTLYNKAMSLVAVPRIESYEELDGKVLMSWERKGHEEFFTAYHIERSKDGKQYERITDLPFINAVDSKKSFGIPPISFTAKANNGVPYYYRVIGIDAFGDESLPSDPVILTAKDLTPPSTPNSIVATYQKEHTMLIEWEQDSLTDDFRGFLVLKGDTYDGEFLPISDTLSSEVRHFRDDGALIYGSTYYKVCAIDRVGNSSCSQPAFGAMVDSIPPATPIGLSGTIDSSGIVTLNWDKNREEDLWGYYVYFSNAPDHVYHRINAQPIWQNTWQDTISLGSLTKEIYYKVAAVDIRSNVSNFSEAVKINKPDTIPPAAALLINYRISDEGIELFWTNSNSRDVEKHELRRRTNDEDWEVIATYYNYEDSHVDKDVKTGMRYEYDISAVDDAGLRSRQTQTFQLVYPVRLSETNLKMTISKQLDAIIIEPLIDEDPELISLIWVYKRVDNSPYRKLVVINDMDSLLVEDRQVKNESTYTYKYKITYKSGLQTNYSEEYTTVFTQNKN